MACDGEHVRSYLVRGTVQGVGFRPAVKRLADELGLAGYVQNTSDGVRLVIRGCSSKLDRFWSHLPGTLGSNSRIDSVQEVRELDSVIIVPDEGFEVRSSKVSSVFNVSIPADLALCSECQKEISDPKNCRYGYAFTTCTNCGPRYTVIDGLPYDRERTTMARFKLCARCHDEYHDPTSRRFRAESIACPDCGPRLSYFNGDGQLVEIDPILAARRDIFAGRIVAVRGIGGFLLVVDAFNRSAIECLRQRKVRPDKPLAVMARSLEVVRDYCQLGQDQSDLIGSSSAPIVILNVKEGQSKILPLDLLSPDSATLGMMLPYSPLHWLLFNPLEEDSTPLFDVLVMTSGNLRSEPICTDDTQAFSRLKGIADSYLIHDRDINLRADDSIVVMQLEKPQLWRRARGLAPNAIALEPSSKKNVLALGAEQKNTIAVAIRGKIYLSPHIGDLSTSYACEGFEQVVKELPSFLRCSPDVIAVDIHPDYYSSRVGSRIAQLQDIEVHKVQHHYAHALSCMVDNCVSECLALVFDGTGLGLDGRLWGAELLACDMVGFKRLATFKEIPLPGGDAAILDPRRQLIARLLTYGIEVSESTIRKLSLTELELDSWRVQIERGVNCPLVHGAGRLFDSVAVMIGVSSSRITYEGQPAVRLESAAWRCQDRCALELPFVLEREGELVKVDWKGAFEMIAAEEGRYCQEQWAFAFHYAVARAAVEMIMRSGENLNDKPVCLSGGVFMNRLLTELVAGRLGQLGIRVLVHSRIPPNDGGIAAGQAAAAAWSS